MFGAFRKTRSRIQRAHDGLYRAETATDRMCERLVEKVRRGFTAGVHVEEQLARFIRLPVYYERTERLVPEAFRIALSTGATVYDSMYLALARLRSCPIATADTRLATQATLLGIGLYQ